MSFNRLCQFISFFAISASAQSAVYPDLSNGACTQLSSLYGNSVLFANSTNYTTETTDYWDVRSDLSPACIFLPGTAEEVAHAVSIFSSVGAQFAVRGGGHMNFPGSNNINGGVLVVLADLDEVVVAADNSSVAAGPGATWFDVYSELDKYDLYCIGGRMKTIGVPGLTLIGGFHYLINKYGFVMDNALSYDVVLGNGTQVIVNSTSNPDLFWALKGGANNFGIVTKFQLKTYPISQISTTVQEFNESQVEAFIKASCELTDNDPPDLGAGSILSITYNMTTGLITPSLLGVQEGTESPPSRFANFSAIPPVSKTDTVLRPATWHAQLDSPFQMFRVQFQHKTIVPDASQLYTIYNAWTEAVKQISDVEGLYPTFVMNIMPKSAMSVAKQNGIGNVWGIDDNQSLIIWQLSTGWANAEDDLRVTSWAQDFVDYWHSANQQQGLASEYLYMGDAGENQNPFLGFPLENVKRMRAIREQYDPAGVFKTLNWGGFKLGQ